jgi:hypothetical protein
MRLWLVPKENAQYHNRMPYLKHFSSGQDFNLYAWFEQPDDMLYFDLFGPILSNPNQPFSKIEDIHRLIQNLCA